MSGSYVLIVDDKEAVRQLLASQIGHLGYKYELAEDAEAALRIFGESPDVSLVLADVHMPGLSGIELLAKLKELDETVQVVMVSGMHDMDTVRECLRRGAYDYLTKPFELASLKRVVGRAQDKTRLLRENEQYRLRLEEMVGERTRELRQTRDIALLTLAKLAESRDNETGLHLERISAFARRLGREMQPGPYSEQLSDRAIKQLERSSTLHDIGKVGIPDSILLKPGPLTDDEFRIMQTHTTIGGDTLRNVIEKYETHDFLVMAMEIAYSHHERWDGDGYPSGVGEQDIPMGGRIVALVDAYDAITSQRPYKSPLGHKEAIDRIMVDRGAHFDPVVADAFLQCHEDFRLIRTGLEARESSPGPPGAGGEAGPEAGRISSWMDRVH